MSGRVQGVGFRPTVWRYAADSGLSGFVKNDPSGVIIEAEGDEAKIAAFFDRIKNAPPEQARIERIDIKEIPAAGANGFKIISSRRSGDLLVGMPPDLATCDDCLKEILDPDDRRYRYPFTNCTNCGPRFTIIRELPYDRPYTSMKSFEMCADCSGEYHNPADRRFDAQPNACPVCGPSLRLVDATGKEVPGDPISEAGRLLKEGKILAVKGLGGYHLCCDAASDGAVRSLRDRKNRPAKSLAVMFASLEEINKHCEVNESEKAELLSTARPIVVLARRDASQVSALVSPDTRDVGAFLPYTPLHHLLLSEISPLIMTSGNIAEEPIAKDRRELDRILGRIADYALVHNRPIVRRCDDSVLKIVRGRRLPVRRSRGMVPDHIELPLDGPPVLACGAELKNTFCVTRGRQAFLSQHIGDLVEYAAYRFYCESIDDMTRLLKITPGVVVCDMHPDYLSTRYALKSGIENRIAVQHHHAHIASCMAENGLNEKVIGVALDGTGYGPDGTVWGGDFLICDLEDFRRIAHFKQYPLPGGDEAVRHPVRMALSYLVSEPETNSEELINTLLPDLSHSERDILSRMITKKIRSPLTSSAGRLFDAVSALLGVCTTITYEGQAAIRLQTLAERGVSSHYSFEIDDRGDVLVISFAPMIREIIEDMKAGGKKPRISAMFHNTVAEAVAETCELLRDNEKINRAVLSGGVFQNDLLLSLATNALHKRGFEVYTHTLVPPNDGGIALGQAAVALARLAQRDRSL